MIITIKNPGLLATIQDLGRANFLSQGMPYSGAMDKFSAQVANLALGNPGNCAVIEFTQSGASFTAETDMLIAFSGGGSFLMAGNLLLPPHRPVFVPARSSFYLRHSQRGCRSYLAVAGGWDVPEVMGSRSTYLPAKTGGLQGRCLESGDRLINTGLFTPETESILRALSGDKISFPAWSLSHAPAAKPGHVVIRVMPGPEFTWFDEDAKRRFLSQPFFIKNNSNRTGYRLSGKPLNRVSGKELLSTAVVPGTVQVTGSGEAILLMADAQTTGGYPRIAQVAAVDLPLCAQLKTGNSVSFVQVDRREAETLYLQQQESLHKIALAIKLKYC